MSFLDWFSTSALRSSAAEWARARRDLALARHDIPAGAPADLADEAPRFSLARDGRRVSAYLIDSDTRHGRVSPGGAAITAGLLAFTCGYCAAVPVAMVYGPPILVVAVVLYWAGRRHDQIASQRDMVFRGESAVTGFARAHAEMRVKQARLALEDKTPFFPVGMSLGAFSAAGDWLGADAGRVLGLSQRDLSTHLFVWGATGSGKTSGLLRPIAHRWMSVTTAGALVIDGKGDLPVELRGLAGYRLLSPETERVALLAALEPHDVVAALAPDPQFAQGDSFWNTSGATLLFHGAMVTQAAARKHLEGVRWTVSDLQGVLRDDEHRIEVIGELAEAEDLSPSLEASLDYFLHCFDRFPENTRGSILATALSWLSPLTEHDALGAWARAAPTDAGAVDVTTAIRGARLGLDVPEHRFGQAARAVSSLLRAQVYRAAKLRGSRERWDKGETDCLVLIDEAAISLGSLEEQMLPIARSLGLSFVCAAQNIEQFEARLKEAGARALLDQFRSQVMFEASVATYGYVAGRGGMAVGCVTTPAESPAFAALPRLESEGVGRSGAERFVIGMWETVSQRVLADPVKTGWRVAPALNREAMPPLADGHAIALLNRAGTLRREIVRTERMFAQAPAPKPNVEEERTHG